MYHNTWYLFRQGAIRSLYDIIIPQDLHNADIKKTMSMHVAHSCKNI